MTLTSHPLPFDRPPLVCDGKRFSIADLEALPSEVPSGPVDYELDDGRLITMVPTGDFHAATQAKLACELIIQGERRGLGVARTEGGVVLWRRPDRLVGPDVAFILARSLPVRRSPEGYLETIPELIIEVRSKNDSREYLERKTADYLTAGAWLVLIADPETKTITAHRPDGSLRTFGERDVLTLDGVLPDFRAAVADLFAA